MKFDWITPQQAAEKWGISLKTLQSKLKELLIAEEKSKVDLLDVFKELGYEIKL
jgi:DNA-binding NtrC family response regulator